MRTRTIEIPEGQQLVAYLIADADLQRLHDAICDLYRFDARAAAGESQGAFAARMIRERILPGVIARHARRQALVAAQAGLDVTTAAADI